MAAETPSLELGHYVSVLRRRWWVVALTTILGIVLAFAYLAVANRQVTATTLVNLNVISSDPFSQQKSPADMIDPDTELQLVDSSAVLGDVSSTLGGLSASTIRSRTDASFQGASTTMKIQYTAGNLEDAEKGADAVADAFLTYRGAQAQNRVQTIVDQLQQQQDNLRADLVRINTIIRDATPTSGRAIQAESDRQLTNIELDSLSSQINTFLGLDTTGGSVLTGAAEAPSRVSPSKTLIVSTGLVLGLILGVILAFAMNMLDRRVRDAYDVRRSGGGRVLGELRGREATVPAVGADLDTLRSVRELLFASFSGGQPPTVAVADLTPTRSASDVAANLAHVVAQAGRPVELVMPDAETDQLTHVSQALDEEQVTLVTPASGKKARSSAGAGTATGTATGTVTGTDAAWTIVAVPPDAPHSSLLAAGRLGHAVVLVVAKGSTRRKDVRTVTQELPALGARVHGTILIPKKRKKTRAG